MIVPGFLFEAEITMAVITVITTITTAEQTIAVTVIMVELDCEAQPKVLDSGVVVLDPAVLVLVSI